MFCGEDFSGNINLYLKDQGNLVYKLSQTTQSKEVNSQYLIQTNEIKLNKSIRGASSESISGKEIQPQYISKTLELKSGKNSSSRKNNLKI